jgi:hypothetical protein
MTRDERIHSTAREIRATTLGVLVGFACGVFLTICLFL